MTTYWLLGLGLAFLLASALWFLIPALHGVPWVPTREKRIRKALQLAGLQTGEMLYDLGAGDARVLIIAAKEFDARAVGVEIGPAQWALGWVKIWLSGSRPGLRPERSRRIRMRCGNFYRTDLAAADVVFVYLTSTQTTRLQEKLSRELRSGARVVSVAADFPGWQPESVDREMLIFVYRMPPAHTKRDLPFPNGVQ